MSTTNVSPVTSTPTSSWINLLISLGASLGSIYTGGATGQLINIAATTAENLITQIQAAKSAAGTTGSSVTGSLVVPIFVSVLEAAIAVAITEGKLTQVEATALSNALSALGKEDTIAKTIVDYTTIGPIVPAV